MWHHYVRMSGLGIGQLAGPVGDVSCLVTLEPFEFERPVLKWLGLELHGEHQIKEHKRYSLGDGIGRTGSTWQHLAPSW